MRLCLYITVSAFAFAVRIDAAPSVELELATQRGVQITAPHEWLQLLTAIGIDDVRIRGMTPGDEAKLTNRGTAERPRYQVVGILTARNQLLLPGETFTPADRAKLKDYFDRLAADGAESLTAPRGRFGLTEKEMAAVLADLSQSIDFETRGQSPKSVLDRLQSKFAVGFTLDDGTSRVLRSAKPVADELQGLTAGTGLAMVLRHCGLVLRPEKMRGKPLAYHLVRADGNAIAQTGSVDQLDVEIKDWPIGWKPQQTPGRTVPSLFVPRNAEIDGYTLEETLAAIRLQIKVPLYLDHAALAAHRIEPSKIQVKLARTRTVYKRIIDRVLLQARLRSHVRVDESGTPFLWVTR